MTCWRQAGKSGCTDGMQTYSCMSSSSSSSSSSALRPWVGLGLFKQMSPATSILYPPISTTPCFVSSSTSTIHLDIIRPLPRWPPGFARNISISNSSIDIEPALYTDMTIDNTLYCTDSLSTYVNLCSGCFQYSAQIPRTNTCGSTVFGNVTSYWDFT